MAYSAKVLERVPDAEYRGGARGWLGRYSPPSEHASPPSEGETRFFRRFLAFIVPRKPYFSPVIERVSPPSESSWHHPWLNSFKRGIDTHAL